MTEQTDLTPKTSDEAVATPAEAAPSGGMTDDILAMIEKAKAEAIERASRQAQSLVDKNVARVQQQLKAQQNSLVGRYRQALADEGADAETIEALDRETAQALELQELRNKANAYDQLQGQVEADKARKEYIDRTCKSLGINPYDPRLKRDADSPDEFLVSALSIFREQFAQTTKGADTEQKKTRLQELQQAGSLDVVGGGGAMTPPTWKPDDLDITSADPAITRTLLKYMGKLSVEDMGRMLAKTVQLMKNNPRYADRPEEAARIVAQKELKRL